MEINFRSEESKKTNTNNLRHSTPAFMPQNGIKPVVQAVEEPTKLHRQLAWQIAPNLLLSFKYAWEGVTYAFVTQRNFRIHTIIGTVAIGLGIFLRASGIEMAVISLTIAMVLVLELLNTALESVVDLTVKHSYHELAKIAKDCAAGAVLIAAIAAIVVACLILLPRIFALLF